MAGTADTLRTSESVPDNLKKRAVVGHKEKRRKLNKTRRKVSKGRPFSNVPGHKACKMLKEGRARWSKKQMGALGARCGESRES